MQDNDKFEEVRARLQALEDLDDPAPSEPDEGHPLNESDPAEVTGEDLERAVRCALFPTNDYGNGMRFVEYFGRDVLNVPRLSWHVWNGRQWASDDDGIEVRRRAQEVSGKMAVEAAYLKGTFTAAEQVLLERLPDLRRSVRDGKAALEKDQSPGEELRELMADLDRAEAVAKRLSKFRSEYRSFSKSTGNTGKIDAMLREAGVLRVRSVEDLDPEPLAVAVENGMLRFNLPQGTGGKADVRLDPHAREDYNTKCMSVPYDPDARAPLFRAFLERVQPDPEMRAFLRRWYGLNISALMVQKVGFHYGGGSNGKSVLADLIAKMMGGYSATAKIESLTGQSRRGASEATPDLVPLMGARSVRASEPEEGERLKEGFIKELSGGEPIMIRGLQKEFVEYTPRFKLSIYGNHKPEIRGDDHGIWRRVMLIPWSVTIPDAEQDRDLPTKLWGERAGILNWLVGGLCDYLENGLGVPQSVLDATAEYREDSDPIGGFLADACDVTGSTDDFEGTKELVDAFSFWMQERGDSEWKPRTVFLRLKSKADKYRDPVTGQTFSPMKKSVSGYRGIKLKDDFVLRRMVARNDTQGQGSSPPDPLAY